MASPPPPRRLDTNAVHAGEPKPRVEGAITLPIFQSSTFEYGGAGGGGAASELKYIRLSNTPNHRALHGKLAALEGAEAALVTASGMAAISTTLLALAKAGDHLLVQETLYGGTHDLVTQDLPAAGVSVDFIDPDAPATWREKLRPETRAIYVETISNPLMQVGDLQAVAAFARAHGIASVIDNTFASPVNFRPAERGFDLSVHSGTKYLNGHDDVVAGAVMGRAALVERIARKLIHLGGILDPHAAFLLHRGCKTLALRVRQQNLSAAVIARFLERHPAVSHVSYPGLESHPQHTRARALFDGFGGMLSFELRGGLEAAERLFARLEVPIVAPSLGGVETLITRPAMTSHAGMPADERRRLGIGDALVRLSVGIEAVEDLVADLDQALSGA